MKTLQWTFAATCLYVEIAIITLLLLPFISPARWQRLFRSRFLAGLQNSAKIYFRIFIAILVLLFLESVREVRKYSEPAISEDIKHYTEAQNLYHMKLFRAQRNLYIAGFALFLCFIIGRLVALIAAQATLLAESEAAKRQAESATAAAQQMLNEKDNSKNDSKEDTLAKGDTGDIKDSSKDAEALNQTREQLEQTKEELYHARLEFESMKKQAQSVTSEYDRLLEEHTKLQKKLSVLQGCAEGSEAKKDN
ncbi:B-cell receptor-associated protein 31-like [Babylonia areolata]|uniref:B-cell receptor-associated protein 31-like n=1 Tax=Babylonia areolata TaxID=304850 RepID=UPI003FD54F3A